MEGLKTFKAWLADGNMPRSDREVIDLLVALTGSNAGRYRAGKSLFGKPFLTGPSGRNFNVERESMAAYFKEIFKGTSREKRTKSSSVISVDLDRMTNDTLLAHIRYLSLIGFLQTGVNRG